MKKIILLSSLLFAITVNAQINLSEERQNQERAEQGVESQNNSGSNSEKALSVESKEQAKFANMTSLLLLNAAMVGYGKACNLNSNSINEINDFFIERYRLKNDKFILEQYNAKINEFASTSPKKDECLIFEKEFNIVLQKVLDAKKN